MEDAVACGVAVTIGIAPFETRAYCYATHTDSRTGASSQEAMKRFLVNAFLLEALILALILLFHLATYE